MTQDNITEQTAAEPARCVTATDATGIRLRAPKWLYDKRIPAGMITLLAGREGIGKSSTSYDIAARLTKGALPGQYDTVPKSAGIVATEDDWECVIAPRLIAARADLRRIYRIEAVTEDGLPGILSVPADLDRVSVVCAEHDIVLIILDPIMSVIHSSLDTHKDREVRQALDPLARFASTSDVAVMALIHVNKSATTDPLNSIMGSRAFPAVARSILYAITDPESGGDNYLLCHAKSNLGPKQPTLRYHLAEHKIELDDPAPGEDPTILTSRVMWDGQDDRTMQDVMDTPREPARPVGGLATRLQKWITGQGRTVSAAEILEAFAADTPATVRMNLTRMVKRGALRKPIHGHYVATDSDITGDVTPPSIPP